MFEISSPVVVDIMLTNNNDTLILFLPVMKKKTRCEKHILNWAVAQIVIKLLGIRNCSHTQQNCSVFI